MQSDVNCTQIRRTNRLRFELRIVFDLFVFDFKFQNVLTTFDFEIAICTYVLCDFRCVCGVCVQMTITRCVMAISCSDNLDMRLNSCSDRTWYMPIVATNGRLLSVSSGGSLLIVCHWRIRSHWSASPMLYGSERYYLAQ
jgi:hypothetical protein